MRGCFGRTGTWLAAAPAVAAVLLLVPVTPAGADPASDYAAAVSADTPLAHWRLDETPPGDTTAHDSAGAHDGSIAGGVSADSNGAVAGDGALAFDGGSGFVGIPSDASLQPAQTVSLEGWERAASSGAGDGYVVRSRHYGYQLNVSGGTPCVYIGANGGGPGGDGTSVCGATRVDDGSWHHLVATKDDTTLALYVDGSLVASAPDSDPIYYPDSTIAIGRDGDCDCGYFHGSLDDVAIYDHALSEDRVVAHYEAAGYTPEGCDRSTNVACDGGFESPVAPSGSVMRFTAGQQLDAWTVDSGDVDVHPDSYHGWETLGHQSLDLNGSGPGSIYQDLPTVPGATYQLGFALAGNPECGDEQTQMRVDWDGAPVDTLPFDTTGHTPSSVGWTPHFYSLTATGTTTRLRFTSLGPAGECGPMIDDVSVSGPPGSSPGGGGGGSGGPGGGSPTDGGAGKPAPTCADSSVKFGRFTIYAACFTRQGTKLVASGRVRVNGLDVSLDGAGSITVDPLGQSLSASAPVTVSVGSIPVFRGRIDWQLKGHLSLPALPTLRVKGLPVTGSLDLNPVQDGYDILANARVGSSSGPSVTGGMTLHVTNDLGLELDKLSLALGQLPIKQLLVKRASLTYERTAGGDLWSGAVAVELPEGLPALDGEVEILHGDLSRIGLTASGINRPIGEIVFLQRLGLDVHLLPHLAVTGLLGLSAGPKIPVLNAPAASLDSTLTADFGNQVTLDATGTVTLAGKLHLADGELKWTVPSRVDLRGHAHVDFGPAAFDAGMSGLIARDGFKLFGNGSVSVGDVSGKGFGYVSEQGVTACVLASAGPVDALLGFGYRWSGGLDLWFDDCKAEKFKTRAHAAGGSRAAAAGQPQSVVIPPGQSQVIVGATGVGAQPRFTLRSPSGSIVDPAHGVSGALDAGGYRWISDPARHGTYVVLVKPAPGTWTLTPIADSPAIASVGSALSVAAPRVATHVRRSGRGAVLTWSARPAAGRAYRFVEVGAGVGHAILVTRRSHGRVRFRPTDTGRGGIRRVEVDVSRDGLPESVLRGASFHVRRPARPARVRGLTFARAGKRLLVRWRAARRASHYDVTIVASDGRRLFFRQAARSRRLVVPVVTERLRVTVSVVPVAADGLSGRARRGTARVPSKRKR